MAKLGLALAPVETRPRAPGPVPGSFVRWGCTTVCDFLTAATVTIRITQLWVCSAARFFVFLGLLGFFFTAETFSLRAREDAPAAWQCPRRLLLLSVSTRDFI